MKYYIYEKRKKEWWKSPGCGYTSDIQKAHLYSLRTATSSIEGEDLKNVLVPQTLVCYGSATAEISFNDERASFSFPLRRDKNGPLTVTISSVDSNRLHHQLKEIHKNMQGV